ncbi:MAG: hypothetical protein ACM30H_05255 [Clostridia bacterium]
MRLLAALLAAVSIQCVAAPFGVQLGDTRLGLDAPPGFSDTGFTGSPRLQELAESLTSASNRILLFALTDADLRRFMQGDQLEAKRYTIIATPRGLEYQRITPATFNSTFVADTLSALGTAAPAGADFRKLLDASPGRLILLAELRRDPEAVSILQGIRLPSKREGRSDEKPQYGLTTTTLLLLRGKPLNVGVYGAYEDDSDLEWIRATTARWIEELQRLNSR